MTHATETITQTCPHCQAIMPVHSGYITWCDQCNWNVAPAEKAKKKSRMEKLYENLGERYSKGLLRHILKQDITRPRFSLTTGLAFILATFVHLSTVVLFLFGVWRIIRGFSGMTFPFYCFTLAIGTLCLFIAWQLRPRLGKIPKSTITRQEFPALYQLVDRIAAALGSSPVDHIAVNGEFNASFGRITWRHQSVLQIGCPLWAILTPQERIALIAHEIGHDVNGDPGRSFYIGTAVDTVYRWYVYVTPSPVAFTGLSIWGLWALIPITILSSIVWLVLFGFIHLLWRDSQKAEYKADYLAATIAGTSAKVGLLEKLQLARIWYNAQQRYILGRGYTDKSRQLFAEVKEEMAQIPAREQERIRRWDRLTLGRFDVTHPPTTHRIEFVQSHAIDQPKITLLATDWGPIDHEMALLEKKTQTEIGENFGGTAFVAPRMIV